jgi:hypothetical protein
MVKRESGVWSQELGGRKNKDSSYIEMIVVRMMCQLADVQMCRWMERRSGCWILDTEFSEADALQRFGARV